MTSFRIPVLLVMVSVASTGAHSQSLSSLRVGDTFSETRKLGAAPSSRRQAGPFLVQKWKLPDGNELSVAANEHSGRIVYLELTWGGEHAGILTDFSGLIFGRTTLGELRHRFSGNGFTYEQRGSSLKVPDGFTLSTSYEVADQPNTVVTFTTKVTDEGPAMDNPASQARLIGISIGQANYLDGLWGSVKVYDSAQSKIKMQSELRGIVE